ncbi:putative phage repressor [Mizugakiibacter sediminis]|uniref:Putative phage repressor n=1 Tax=Mizugakiibacter sediminis TaxID=1475481 RepID=A0A0K8QPK1_9GAMM|nr:helix-turn-helix transcriptional regulator [Mizugakiibacter sediminis]GAP66823.1 putative phage repressor [Mizugakiibacter sediminis]
MSKRPLTPEEKAIARRIKAAIASDPNLTEESVGAQVGVTQGQVSHWTNGRLPVPAARAIKLASVLGIDDPAEISLAYREIAAKAAAGSAVAEGPAPGLASARVENDIDALRYALAAMVTVMVVHRPAEAADVARALRKHVPAKFVRQGYIHELLKVLDSAASAKPKVAAPPPLAS